MNINFFGPRFEKKDGKSGGGKDKIVKNIKGRNIDTEAGEKLVKDFNDLKQGEKDFAIEWLDEELAKQEKKDKE